MRIAVFGATGHTGRLVVRALRARGDRVLACGRDAAKLTRVAGDGVDTRVVDVTNASDVRAALRTDIDGVANLAGPFLATGPIPIEAALRQGIPYVDTTGEQHFMRLAQRRYHARAIDSGVAVVNALAYEYAFGDMAARAFFPEGGDALHVMYRARGTGGSAGTKKSILRVAAAPSLSYENGALIPTRPARYTRTFTTPDGPRDAMSFPGGEPLTVPRHTPFQTVRTYLAARPRTIHITKVTGPIARVALRGPILRALERRVDRAHRAPENAAARAEVRLVAERDGRTREAAVLMGDPYLATAVICAEGIAHLASGKHPSGVVAPAEVFDAAWMLGEMVQKVDGFSLIAPS